MASTITVVRPHRWPRLTQDTSRKVTGGPQDTSPISHSNPIIANIEARVGSLEVRSNHHEDMLNEHDGRLKEHEDKLTNQDRILDKDNEILESLKNTHCEHIRWTKATHGIAATSYIRWHGGHEVVDRLKVENMDEF